MESKGFVEEKLGVVKGMEDMDGAMERLGEICRGQGITIHNIKRSFSPDIIYFKIEKELYIFSNVKFEKLYKMLQFIVNN